MKLIRLFIMTWVILFYGIVGWADVPASSKVPVIQIQDPVYTFPVALEGDYVVHDYIVKNTGTADLKIIRVTST